MADFETKLRRLSERGTPVGAEELIERIEAELAGGPLVVVANRREGALMTKTSSRMSGAVWALATFVVVLAVGGLLYLAVSGGGSEVADSTTVAPTTTVSETTIPTASPTVLDQENHEPIAPGDYFIDKDGSPATSVGAIVTINTQGWIGSREGVNFNGDLVSLHLRPFVEPFTPGCGLTAGTPLAAGSTAIDVVDAMATSGLTVQEAPAPVSAFGRDGYHVVVAMPPGCEFGGDPGFTHNNGEFAHLRLNDGDVIEAWVFDIAGDIVMVEALWLSSGVQPPEATVAMLRAVIDSLVLTP